MCGSITGHVLQEGHLNVRFQDGSAADAFVIAGGWSDDTKGRNSTDLSHLADAFPTFRLRFRSITPLMRFRSGVSGSTRRKRFMILRFLFFR